MKAKLRIIEIDADTTNLNSLVLMMALGSEPKKAGERIEHLIVPEGKVWLCPSAQRSLRQKRCVRIPYGLQVQSGLTYSQATAALGSCIMHALACDGKLDNREKGEK